LWPPGLPCQLPQSQVVRSHFEGRVAAASPPRAPDFLAIPVSFHPEKAPVFDRIRVEATQHRFLRWLARPQSHTTMFQDIIGMQYLVQHSRCGDNFGHGPHFLLSSSTIPSQPRQPENPPHATPWLLARNERKTSVEEYRFSRVMERIGSFLRFLRGRARCGTQMPPFSLGRRPYTGARSILGTTPVIFRPDTTEELPREMAFAWIWKQTQQIPSNTQKRPSQDGQPHRIVKRNPASVSFPGNFSSRVYCIPREIVRSCNVHTAYLVEKYTSRFSTQSDC